MKTKSERREQKRRKARKMRVVGKGAFLHQRLAAERAERLKKK